jgi:hypothetical protein
VIAHAIGDAFRSALVIEPVDRDIGTRGGKFDSPSRGRSPAAPL